MSFNKKEAMEQREAGEDNLYAMFFGHKPLQPHVEKIYQHVINLPLEKRYKDVLDKVFSTHDRMPKLAVILFALWLCPSSNWRRDPTPCATSPF